MAVEKEVENNAIDMMISLIVSELAEEQNWDPDEAFYRFVSSKTGELLYDGETKLWCNGPAYIIELFKDECELK